MKKIIICFYLVLFAIVCNAQTLISFSANVFSGGELLMIQWSTEGSYREMDFKVYRAIDNGPYKDVSVESTNHTYVNNFSVWDTLYGTGEVIYYDIYRKKNDQYIPVKAITVYDGEIAIIMYPQKAVNNLIVNSTRDLFGRLRITDQYGRFVMDGEYELSEGLNILSNLRPGNYSVEFDSPTLQKLFVISIE